MKTYLIEEDPDSSNSRLGKDAGLIWDELLEEDLVLRKKLDDLEGALDQVNKEIKPTLQTMEKELSLLTEEIKLDKEKIEVEYEKLKETWNAFSITCEALSEWIGLDVNDAYFSNFVKENADELIEIDRNVQCMKESTGLQSTSKS